MVPFGPLNICNSILVSSCGLRKKTHYNSRVSLHEAPTRNWKLVLEKAVEISGGGSLSDPPEDEESTIPMFSFGSGLRHPNDRTNVFTSDPFLCHRIPYSHTTTGSDLLNQSGSTAFLQASTGRVSWFVK